MILWLPHFDDRERGVDAIVLADGTTWTRADLRRLLAETRGTEGADSLAGSSVADTMIGLGGAGRGPIP